ncbi:DUF2280 domain-containing protein [Acinetobacter baumannii]|nr:DUF2280 domain-containing protein [Acinetobacter baumannii]
MATLKEPVKIFIVQSLACRDTPQEVAELVKQEFGVDIDRVQVATYDPTKDKLYHELLLEAAACHLIEDWKGVVFEEKIDGGEVVETEPEYSPENAVKLLNMGDIGISIWLYVKQEAEDIQKEADAFRNEVVGKSQPSTTGASSTQKKKRATTTRSKQRSQKP